MRLKDYLTTQEEFNEFIDEYEEWCSEQDRIWGYTRADCQMDQDAAAGYRVSGILAMDPIPTKETVK